MMNEPMRMMRTARLARAGRAGFTLIEVLIAVLVLSLGVLGLAAVFSVGIPQQRIAIDQIQGLNAIESARAVLLGNQRLNNPVNPAFPSVRQKRGWYGLQQRVAENANQVFEPDETWSPMGEWIIPLDDPGGGDIDERWMALDPVAEDGDGDVGEMVIVSPERLQQLNVRIGLEQRLVPAPYTSNSEPQYVWDFVARRVPSGRVDQNTGLVRPTKQDPIEVAVFVRRVDPGIRVQLTRRDDEVSRVRYGPRLRLSDYLTMNAEEITGGGPIVETQRVVPVSMNPDSSQPRQDGRTLGGGNVVGEYATVFGVGVASGTRYPGRRRGGGPGDGDTFEIPRDRLPLEAGGGGTPDDENRLRLASQTGQRLIDRFGNVYTVLGLDADLSEQLGATVVRIEPAVPLNVSRPADFRVPNRSELDGQAFITTPQIPVAVDVFRVQP